MSSEVETKPYSEMTIAELRRAREKKVENLEFEEVHLIDEAIQNIHQDNTEKVIAEESKKLSEAIDTLFERYSKGIDETNKKASETEDKYRNISTNNIEQMKDRHEKKKVELEVSKSKKIQRAETRGSAKNIELIGIAKNLARQGEIEEAIEYRTASQQIKEQEIQMRKEEINQCYDKIMSNINDKQESNAKIIEDNFTSALDRIQSSKEEELKARNQALRVNLTSALQKAVYSGTRNVKREKRADFIQRINGFVQNKLETEKTF